MHIRSSANKIKLTHGPESRHEANMQIGLPTASHSIISPTNMSNNMGFTPNNFGSTPGSKGSISPNNS